MFWQNILFLGKFYYLCGMKDKNIKRHVGRPATGVTRISVTINLSHDMNEKLYGFSKEKNVPKSKIVEQALNLFFNKYANVVT